MDLLGWNDRYICCRQQTEQDGGLRSERWWILAVAPEEIYGPFFDELEYGIKLEELSIDPPIELYPTETYSPERETYDSECTGFLR